MQSCQWPEVFIQSVENLQIIIVVIISKNVKISMIIKSGGFMKEKYTVPEMEIIAVSNEDVITTSSFCPTETGDDTF